MKTYLVFFGKSQYFTTHTFDNQDYIENFNTVIKDFDLLESKIFTVDGLNNKEMLSKYHFTANNGKKYSMIKLYSFAQAYSGDRIAGSIYGVALLSENDLSLSQINLNILKNAKSSFAKLCLNELKFKVSDFKDEAYRIWSAFINHKEGNYLDKVDYTKKVIGQTNLPTKGFHVNKLFDDATAVEIQLNSASRIYISEDLDHLKRANVKWGADFQIYVKSINGYEIYREPKPIQEERVNKADTTKTHPPIPETLKLKDRITELEDEIVQIEKQSNLLKKKSKATIIIICVLSFVILALMVSKYFKSEEGPAPAPQPVAGPIPEPVHEIKPILIDANNIDSLLAFAQAYKYIFSVDTKSVSDSLKLYKNYTCVQSLANDFNFDVSSIEEQFGRKKIAMQQIANHAADENPKSTKQNKENNKKTANKPSKNQ
jgi:hypothetical protein